MLKWLSLALLSVLLLLFSSYGSCAENEYHILHTQEATTTGQGAFQTEIEAGVVKQGDESELYNVPRVRLTYGLSEWADIEIDYENLVVEDTSFTRFPSGERVEDHDDAGTGDVVIQVKMSPWQFGRHQLGVRGITKLPNADRERGLGTDEADFMWGGMLTSDWGRLTTHLNAGMAILGDPTRSSNQKDYIIWGVGAEYDLTETISLMAELYGSFRGEHGEDGFTDNVAEGSYGSAEVQAALALTGPLGDDWRWGLHGFKGLNNHSDDWGVQLGLSRIWDIGFPEEAATAPPERRPQPETFYNPMSTRTAYTIPERSFHLELAGKYVNQVDDSDLYVAPDLTLGWGIGPWADFRLEFQYLKVEDTMAFDSDENLMREDFDKNGMGDVWVKFKVSPFECMYGRLGAQLVTKAPSANDDGLGTDEVDIFLKGIFSTEWANFFPDSPLSRLRTHLNAGIAIEGNPHSESSQHDVFIWGILAEYGITESSTLWAELQGSKGNSRIVNISEGVYGDNMLQARLGLTGPLVFLDDWKWGITASTGLTNDSPDWSAGIGISRTWGL